MGEARLTYPFSAWYPAPLFLTRYLLSGEVKLHFNWVSKCEPTMGRGCKSLRHLQLYFSLSKWNRRPFASLLARPLSAAAFYYGRTDDAIVRVSCNVRQLCNAAVKSITAESSREGSDGDRPCFLGSGCVKFTDSRNLTQTFRASR